MAPNSFWPTHAFAGSDSSASKSSVAALAADSDRAIAHSWNVLQDATCLRTFVKLLGNICNTLIVRSISQHSHYDRPPSQNNARQ